MNITTGKALLLTVLLASMAVSGWYFASDDEVYALNDEQLQESVDTRAGQLLVKKFDKQGNVTQRLYTPQLTHIPKGDQNRFTEPRVTLYNNGESPWYISSKEGFSQKGGEKIQLLGSVVIQQPISTGGEHRILTESLDYYPQKQYAETEKSVLFKKPGVRLKGDGMHAWLASKSVQLLDNVQGRYDP